MPKKLNVAKNNCLRSSMLPKIIAKEVEPSWSDSCRASAPASLPGAPIQQCGPACHFIHLFVCLFFSEKFGPICHITFAVFFCWEISKWRLRKGKVDHTGPNNIFLHSAVGMVSFTCCGKGPGRQVCLSSPGCESSWWSCAENWKRNVV